MTPRRAVFAAFFGFGIGYGLWAGAIARVAERSAVSPQLLGFAITGFIAAALTGMAAGGACSRRFAVKHILLAATAAVALTLVVLMQVASPAGFVLGLFAYGMANGIMDGAMNAEGTAVERDLGRPVLAGFHAAASLAAAAAALLGSVVAVWFGTGVAAALAVAGLAGAFAAVLSATPDRPAPATSASGPRRGGAFRPPIVILGLIVGISIAGETAAAMFSAPMLQAQAPDLAAYAGFGATAFLLFQALIRSIADLLRRRFGDLRVIEASTVFAALGFTTVALSGAPVQSAVGFALVGIGTAALVPCGFSLAPTFSGMVAAEALGILALVSALPRLPAPLALGEIADRFAFSAAFGVNAVLFAIAFGLAMCLRRATLPGRMERPHNPA